MPIKILAENVTNKIAAGEVVENPASVVKELVENAIDASARTIKICIRGAGKELIEVSDDGTGIPRDEITLAITRFATSKIDSIDDLQSIRSLGFRGEALASIAAVSHMKIQTRAIDEREGSELICEGGKVKAVTGKAFPQGSQFEIRNLFMNIPARLKFLKSDRTERSRIMNLVVLYALTYPHIRFNIEIEGRTILQTSGNGNRREILAEVYDLETARQMLEVDLTDPDQHIEGFCSPVGITRSNRRDIHFFVNGRLIADVGLTSALVSAYHSYVMVGRYPIAVIFIELSPDEVDINIHPAKAEVRFVDARSVMGKVARAVRLALLSSAPAPTLDQNIWAFPTREQIPAIQNTDESFSQRSFDNENKNAYPSLPTEENQPALEMNGHMPLLRVVGQVGATYIVAEGPDGLYLIDQHAAHERILYEDLLNKNEQKKDSQLLLEPLLFSPGARLAEIFEEIRERLDQVGFKIEDFGPETYSIRAVPSFMGRNFSMKIISDAIQEVSEEGKSAISKEKEEILIRSICKGAAVKGGMVLSKQEQETLVRQLELCQNPRTCPHGRPTMIHLTVEMLEKQFGRRGSL
ncbi:MAG TPA: DNA mismatch repair endonuclease MutL [Anaerolineaceae bacterium]|uniref:DNA mismatch repair protein MutL n=1 Tax=Anaerolinea thermophila TaxID=167964 RepID=A0A101FY09_9CHLR|nr:MAG: DNA mismatch repair protein MutL [Anaerolinea thermophila]HAF61944.1 DNA mismatch repair endonuclease MutL [Anaerolineaceae bacterium]